MTKTKQGRDLGIVKKVEWLQKPWLGGGLCAKTQRSEGYLKWNI